MKKSIMLVLAVVCFSGVLMAQDIVYLKNGSIIHGSIIEAIPDASIKIQTTDGNVFVYKMNEVSKIVKESSTVQDSTYKKTEEKKKESRPFWTVGNVARGVILGCGISYLLFMLTRVHST